MKTNNFVGRTLLLHHLYNYQRDIFGNLKENLYSQTDIRTHTHTHAHSQIEKFERKQNNFELVVNSET